MCGIAGFVVAAGSNCALDEQVLLRMRDSMIHRGPDDAGLYCAPGVGLGHRRLSIVDVAHGHQPMASEDDRYHIVYNGEVFNHPTLKLELEQEGVHYRTRCDTETVLHLFSRLGAAAPKRMRGMFAVSVWDSERRELILARDRFGVKPLYYAHLADGTLLFGSEIKAITSSGLVKAEMNHQVLPDLLANFAPSAADTLFRGVQRLLPGHVLVWRDGRIRMEQYWDVPVGEVAHPGQSEADLVAEYHERLKEAVRIRLMSDVPLGTFLSGGIDSAAITALTSQMTDGGLKTFSVAFNEREANELMYARLVATAFRTDHHEVTVSEAQFWGALPKMLWHEDEPIAHPSSIALHFVSELASRHVKVVLTGEGADETLGGYNRYRAAILNQRFARYYARCVPARARRMLATSIQHNRGRGRNLRRASRTFLGLPGDLDSLYFENFAVFGRSAQHGLLATGLRERLAAVDPYEHAHAALARHPGATMLQALLYSDTKTYLHELLMKQDQMSMSASIESRVPFLDHPLVEWVSGLPDAMRLRGVTTKAILRDAMRTTLPAPILSRKKLGFPVPVGAWFKGAWSPMLREFILGDRASSRGLFNRPDVERLFHEHLSGALDHAERLWMLLNIEIWHRVILDGESTDAVAFDLLRNGKR